MAEILKTPSAFMTPNLESIKDEETKKILEEYNKILTELFINVNSDLTWLYKRIYDLEHP